MKKQIIVIFLLGLILCFAGCSQTGIIALTGGFYAIDKEEIRMVEGFKDKTTEHHLYNKNDEEKNRFLQFLNDEIPLVDYDVYTNTPETVYASEIYMGDSEDNLMPDMYYVLDMDGDGENEFCFYSWLTLNIIKYNHERNVFTLWLSLGWDYKPLGTGKVYAIIDGERVPPTKNWIYKAYDQNGNLLVNNLYSMTWEGENDIGEEKIVYNIWENTGDTLEVFTENISEKEWIEHRAYLMNLIEYAPAWLTYEQLLN